MIKILIFFEDKWQVLTEIRPDDKLLEYYKQNFVCEYPEPEVEQGDKELSCMNGFEFNV